MTPFRPSHLALATASLTLAAACAAAPAAAATASPATNTATAATPAAPADTNAAPAAPAPAPAASDATVQAVYVTGSRDPDWKTYRAYLAGLQTHEKLKQLAPQAPLRFLLRPQTREAGIAGVTLRIEGDNVRIPVPIAADGTFTLPDDAAAAADDATLSLNRKKGLYRWRPDIHTPGVPAGARRLGDLRLECEVRWAIEQADAPAVMRVVFNAAGGACHSSHIQVDFLSPRPIASARFVSGARSMDLPADRIEQGGQVYDPPVDDASWPDDTLVEFTFRAEAS